jgi:hypothetical protein
MTMTEGAMLRGLLDSPPEPTETERAVAHGRLLLTSLYERDPLKRNAARRAITLLLDLADGMTEDT